MEYSRILDSGDFSSFLIEKSPHVYNTRRIGSSSNHDDDGNKNLKICIFDNEK